MPPAFARAAAELYVETCRRPINLYGFENPIKTAWKVLVPNVLGADFREPGRVITMVGDFLDAPKDPQPFVGMSPAPFYYGYSSIYQSWGEDVENGILCMSLARALDRWPADLKTMCANIRSARRNNATTIKVSLRVRDAAALEAFVHEFGPASRDVPHKLVAATLSAAAEISADKPWPVEVMLNSAAAREAGVERLDDADATRFITLTSGELAGFARADDVVEEILEQSEGRTEDERPVSL